MRRLAFLLAAGAAACAVPEPCTRALCPTRVAGTYRVVGWKTAATVDASVPPVPVASDADIMVTAGQIEFMNNKALIVAAAGSEFKLLVSTQPRPVPQLYVSSGAVSVAQTPGSPFVPVPPGTRWLLPQAPKGTWW
jgi:hypothetical protein